MTDCSRTRDAVPLTMASKVPLAVAACAAWRGAEQKKTVQALSAVPCKYRWAEAEQ